jgi:calpain-7
MPHASINYDVLTSNNELELPKDDERCKSCHELCMQAMNKVDELKKNSSVNGHYLSPPSRDLSVKDDHHYARSISSVSSSIHSMTISNGGVSDIGTLKCKTDENSMKKLSTAEIDLLKMTSNVNSKLFLPWMEEADLREKFTFSESFM